MKRLQRRLSYSNIVATLALFVALGGASYAAVRLPENSVGTAQIRNGAVSRSKLKAGVINTKKLADGAVVGAKVNASTLGTVPNAAFAATAQNATTAANAQHAAAADRAAQATAADFAGEAEYAEFLGERELPAGAFGARVLVGRTDIPATTTDQEWWIPVSGIGEPKHSEKEAEEMIATGGYPVEPLFTRGFSIFTWTGPGEGGEADVRVSLHDYFHEKPVGGWNISVVRLDASSASTGLGPGIEMPTLSPLLAYKVVEKPNGEEIPALGLQTALFISPSP